VEKTLRDGLIVAACVVWGSQLERDCDRDARKLTPGLNFRDLLLLRVLHDRGGRALPSELIGPVHTTAPGVSGSLKRLEGAGLATRGVGADARTRPVKLTPAADALAETIAQPWAQRMSERLARLDDAERDQLYRLLMKGSGQWGDIWPDDSSEEGSLLGDRPSPLPDPT
jgi:DNA-binding MarR family transcriptional regulator